MNKVLLIVILSVASFLLFYRLSELMIFIGDFGWFYLSSRDMLLTGEIPLVGIASSHPWLHQGSLWTYMLAVGLWFMAYSPFAGAYIGIAFGLLTIIGMYKIGSTVFSKKVGLIAAVLYTTSPLIIIHSRMPYHTSPIPFFALLWFWSVYQWIKGKLLYFPLAIFSLAILYNFELATLPLVMIFLLIIAYGVWKRKIFVAKIRDKKILSLSFLAFFIPMLPILFYDVTHGFPQTFRFIAWIGYRILKIFGLFGGSGSEHTIGELASFFLISLQRLLFLPNEYIALFIFIGSFCWMLFQLYNQFRKKKFILGDVLLGVIIFISFLGLFITKTPSEAYLPMLFPFVILMVTVFFASLMEKKSSIILGSIAVVLVGVSNSYALINRDYLMGAGGYGPTFEQRLAVAKEIVEKANEQPYQLSARGEGSQFASFTMNYEYLTWWLGNTPVEEAEKEFVVQENLTNIKILEK